MLRKYFSALLCAFLPFSVVLADTAMTAENRYIRKDQLARLALQASLDEGMPDFKAAVLQYSEEPERKLSDVIVQSGTAYLLYFLDRKEAETRSLEAVKPEIIAELQQEYRQDQEKVMLDGLREKFKQNAKM